MQLAAKLLDLFAPAAAAAAGSVAAAASGGASAAGGVTWDWGALRASGVLQQVVQLLRSNAESSGIVQPCIEAVKVAYCSMHSGGVEQQRGGPAAAAAAAAAGASQWQNSAAAAAAALLQLLAAVALRAD
jgi:hypothetical protein